MKIRWRNCAEMNRENKARRTFAKGEFMNLEKMDEFFESRLDGYDRHMLTEIEGADTFYEFTARQLPQSAEIEILDLGCGTGLELERYFALNPRACVTGIDLSSGMLAALKRKFPEKALRLIRGSYFDVPFEKEKYDAAVSVESLHHFTPEQKIGLYRKLRTALKPNGYFILTDYFAENDEFEHARFEEYERLKSKLGINGGMYHFDTPLTLAHETEILRAAGFSRVEKLKKWGATFTIRADI